MSTYSHLIVDKWL